MISVPSHQLPLSGSKISGVLSVFLICLITISASAQEEPVKRSKVIEIIEGKKYYIHEVKAGQTVYSIADAYNVSPKQIYQYNPDAKEMLKPAQMLKIPVFLVEKDRELQRELQKTGEEDQAEEQESEKQNHDPARNKNVTIHKVKDKETLYSLARKYNTTPGKIKELNPGMVDVLQKGQEVRVPFPEVQHKSKTQPDSVKVYSIQKGDNLYRIALKHELSVKEILRLNPKLDKKELQVGSEIKLPVKSSVDEIQDGKEQKQEKEKKDYFIHEVQAGETLYSLSIQYSVGISVLKDNNPELDEGLKVGQKLKIPAGQEKEAEGSVILPEKDILDSLMFIKQKDTNLAPCDSLAVKRSYHVALFMPLFLDDVHEIKVENYRENGWPEEKFKAFQYIHFYEGFLMALDSMEKAGMKAQVYIYDTKGRKEVVKQLVEKKEFQNFDLIFGPFREELLPLVVDAAKDNSTEVVAPTAFGMGQVKTNPHLIKIIPPVNFQIEKIVSFIASEHKKDNLIFVYSESGEQEQMLATIQQLLADKMGISTNEYPWNTVEYDSGGYYKVKEYLKEDTNNLIFSMHKGEAKINRYITRLNGLREDYDITVFGSNRWENYGSIESQYLNNLHYTSFTNFLVEYEDVRVKSFVRNFIRRYHTWPHDQAFMGFDVGYYFLSALYNYGENFPHCMQYMDVFTMHTEFDFKQWETNAWQNRGLNIYQYRGFKRENLIREFKTIDQ
ncbi:MAG: LysM peptidoglycan-binding domain-containing protein [Bacteroidales bacterium]